MQISIDHYLSFDICLILFLNVSNSASIETRSVNQNEQTLRWEKESGIDHNSREQQRERKKKRKKNVQ